MTRDQTFLPFDFGSQPLPFTHKRALTEGPLRHNLYFAIVPDASDLPDTIRMARHVCNAHAITRRQSPNVYHITLRWLWACAELTDEILEQAEQIGRRIQGSAFDLELTDYQSFGGDAVVLTSSAKTDGFTRLHRKIDDALKVTGVKPKRDTPTPHLTIAYDDQRIELTPLQEPITLHVREFVLVDSIQGAGHHNHLARYPLFD